MTENRYASHLKKWVFATKLNSWPKILLPALLGQSIGFISGGSFNGPGLIAGLGFSFFGLIYIVLLNDFGDQFVDAPPGCGADSHCICVMRPQNINQ